MSCTGRKCGFFVFLLFNVLYLRGQRNISGQVSNESGGVVSFASVKWKNDSAGIARNFSIADAGGHYNLIIANDRSGWIEVSAVGYTTRRIPVNVSDITTIINITLVATGKELPGIIIKNEPSVVVSGDTTSYQADRFKRGNEASISELLTNIPGFSIDRRGILTYNGKIIDRVLINGDDLVGRGYSGIINNLNITGIDKLQVIQNYADNSNIISGITGGKEQVLNIAYKKNFLHRLFGTLDAGLGMPVKYYNAGLQALALFDKAKALVLQNINSTGKTTFDPLPDGNLYEGINVDPVYDIDIAPQKNLADISDILVNSGIVNAIYRNRSISSTANILLRPIKELSVRGQLNITYDKYGQRMDRVTDYFIDQQAARIIQNKDVLQKLQKISGLLSFNYLLNSQNQFVLTLKAYNFQDNGNAVNFLTGAVPFEELLKRKENQYAGKFIYNRLFSGTAAFSVNLQYQRGRMPGDYFTLPGAFKDFFRPGNYSGFNQDEIQKFYTTSGQMTYIKRINKHVLTIGLNARQVVKQLGNSISLNTASNEPVFIGIDSVSNVKNQLNSISLLLQDAWTINKKLTTTFSAGILGYRNRLLDLNSSPGERKEIKDIRLLPGINTEYKFSGKSRLSFSYSLVNQFTDLQFAFGGFWVNNLTSVYRGLDSLQMNLSQTARLSYFYTNLLEKRLLFFSNILYVKTPLFYLTEIRPYQDFIYFQSVPVDRTIDTWILSLSVQKLSDDYHTKISPLINLSKGNNYRVIQGKEEKIRFRQVQLGLDFSKDFKKLQVKSHLLYSIKQQKVTEERTNRYFESLVKLNWKHSNQFFTDIEVQYSYLKPSDQRQVDWWTTGVKFLYRTKNGKWDIGLHGTNLLNQYSYSETILTAINSSTTSYRLFPRILMGYVRYRF